MIDTNRVCEYKKIDQDHAPVRARYFRLNMLKKILQPMALGILLSAPSNAIAVTLWNWSFVAPDRTAGLDQTISGSGTFVTADVTPTPGTIYEIIGISGIYDDSNFEDGTGIVSLSSSTIPKVFRYDGESSPLITDFRGIKFVVLSGMEVHLQYRGIDDYGPAGTVITRESFTRNGITREIFRRYDNVSSNLSPVGAGDTGDLGSATSTSVPAPLSVFCAGAAFKSVRRMRELSKRLHRR
jgi:hypothetical protein